MNQVVADNKLFSLSEWFANLGFEDVNKFRQEDNDKRERLEILFKETGLLYDRPDKFPAVVVKERQPEFLTYLEKNKDRLCAFRLVPEDPSLPKLRMRGQTVGEAMSWLDRQKIDFNRYRLDIVPHTNQTIWSAIFVVKPEGIAGEIISGGHNLLTMAQAPELPLIFKYDFKNWQFSQNNPAAEKVVKQAVEQIRIDKTKQSLLKEKLQAEFTEDYLVGYWEFTVWPDNKIYFIDYNRLLADLLDIDFKLVNLKAKESELSGAVGFAGRASGQAVKISEEQVGKKDFNQGDILVCQSTSPTYLPLMKKAAGIITDQGGVLSHAAIIARELKIPCVVGTKQATKIINDGDMIEIDGVAGIIKINSAK